MRSTSAGPLAGNAELKPGGASILQTIQTGSALLAEKGRPSPTQYKAAPESGPGSTEELYDLRYTLFRGGMPWRAPE